MLKRSLKLSSIFAVITFMTQMSLAYEQYHWAQIGSSFTGQLNYKGTNVSNSQSAGAADQAYSGVAGASAMMFSSLQSEVLNLVNTDAKSIATYRGATVAVGSPLTIKMLGKGTASNLNIQLPPITATLNFKKEALLGLVVFQCAVTLSLPNSTMTGTLNVGTGALTNMSVHSNAVAGEECKDNVPLIGSLLAKIADKVAANAITPTLNNINAAGGIPMSNKNFLGLNQLFNSSQFEYDNIDYGTILAQDLESFVNNTEVDIKIYNLQTETPVRQPLVAAQKATTTQNLFVMTLPDDNISVTVLANQIYGTTGTNVAGREP